MPTMGTTAVAHAGTFIANIQRLSGNVSVLGFPNTVKNLMSEDAASLRLQENNCDLPEHLAKLLAKQTFHAQLDFNTTQGMFNRFAATYCKWLGNKSFFCKQLVNITKFLLKHKLDFIKHQA